MLVVVVNAGTANFETVIMIDKNLIMIIITSLIF